MDNFYLNLAVYDMEEFFNSHPEAHAHFQYGRPEKGHGWLPWPLPDFIRTLAQHLSDSAPSALRLLPLALLRRTSTKSGFAFEFFLVTPAPRAARRPHPPRSNASAGPGALATPTEKLILRWRWCSTTACRGP